jgi:hypothetical protein
VSHRHAPRRPSTSSILPGAVSPREIRCGLLPLSLLKSVPILGAVDVPTKHPMAASLIARGASSDHLQFHHRRKRAWPRFRHANQKLHHQGRAVQHPPFLPRRRARVSSNNRQVRMLLRGVGKRDSRPRQKAPKSIAFLEECLRALNLHDPAYQALWGVLCLAFFFILRRSEIVAITTTTCCWFALSQ